MRKTVILVCSIALAAFLGSMVDFDGAVAAGENMYIGASKCKTCHKKPEVGEQFTTWEKTKHAGAFATLAGEKAMEIAKAKGIDNPQEADACLKCHVTGHGVAAEFLGPKYDKTEGVTCEACHGAGGAYYKKTTMVALMSGEIEGDSVGLVTPDEKTCTGCHNEESPTFTAFNYEEMVKKIAHPIPDAKKAEYKAEG